MRGAVRIADSRSALPTRLRNCAIRVGRECPTETVWRRDSRGRLVPTCYCRPVIHHRALESTNAVADSFAEFR